MEEFGKELDPLSGVSGKEELRILQFFGSPSTLEALVSPLSGLDINAAKYDFLTLLSSRPNIVNTNEEYETRRTALMVASSTGYTKAVELLIHHKADIFIIDAEGLSCLHLAVAGGHLDVVRVLLNTMEASYSTRTFVDLETTEGDTALMLACKEGHLEISKLLIEKNANMEVSAHGWNCLHFSARYGHHEVSFLMLESCRNLIDSAIRGKESLSSMLGFTSLMLASKFGHHDVVKLLLEHKASVMMTSKEGWNCLHYAARWGHFEVSKLILEACPKIINYGTIRSKGSADVEHMDSNLTPLMLACQYGHERIVELLLEHKADVRMRTELGWNCLHYAGRWGHFEVSRLIIKACAEMINDRTENGNLGEVRTTLMLACENGHEDVVKLLLEHKADVMIFSDFGWNCFHYAARWGGFEVSKLIIEACVVIINIGTLGTNSSSSSRSSSSSVLQGSTPDKNVMNETGLMLACESGNEQVVRLLLAHKADVMVYSECGRNCLHYAARWGHSEVSSLLIQEFPQLRDSTIRGAAKCPPNDCGKTALMLASQFGHDDVVKSLLEHKASVLMTSEAGLNCLHYAARWGHFEVSKLIIEACPEIINDGTMRTKITADLEFDVSNETPLMLACLYGHEDVVKLLLEHKADVMVYSESGRNCLHYAAESGHSEVSSLLIQEFPQLRDSTIRGAAKCPPNDCGKTALMLASQSGHHDVVKSLLEHKASVMMTSEAGLNCLHYAARSGHFEVSKLILEACPEIINDGTMRTKITADLEYDVSNETPLMLACLYGHEDVVKLLLEHKADVMVYSESGRNCLHYAARWGHSEVSSLLIQEFPQLRDSTIRGAAKCPPNDCGKTALMLASQSGHHDVVKSLLEHKASVMMTSEAGLNCLHYAARSGHFEVSKLILEACPEIINYGTIRSKGSDDLEYMDSNLTPLMLACRDGHERIVELLLKHKADVRMRTELGWNCLHYAGRCGHFEVSRLIIKACAEMINDRTENGNLGGGRTTLMLACENGHEDVVKLLLEHKADVMIFSDYGWNCFHHAAERGHSEVSSLLIQEFPQLRDSTTRVAAKCPPDDSGKTALMLASQSGQHDVVKLLLEHKASVMMTSEEGWNCLHYAARSGHFEVSNDYGWNCFHYGARNGHFEVSKLILEACPEIINRGTLGGDIINSRSSSSSTPQRSTPVVNAKNKTGLMLACENGHEQVVRLLLAHKANVMVYSESGRNCLHYAAERGHSEVSSLLIQEFPQLRDSTTRFAAKCPPDDSGKTALMLASQYGKVEVVRTLLSHKADVMLRIKRDAMFCYMLQDQLLIEHKASVMMTSEEGWNCLHYAARWGHFEVSKLIIEACPEIINDGTMRTKITADLEYMNSNKTPLMIACRYGHERVVELLLEHKADVRMRDECGWNCLHYAGRWGGFEVSKLIVEACPEIINYGTKRSKGSADLNTMDLNKTPLMLACLNGREDVVKLLLEHKADVMIFNDSGCNCFHYAASWGRFEVSKLIIEACPEIINIGTLGTNSSISSSSSSSIPQGSTPVVKVKIEKNITGLMLACESGNEQVVRLLLAHKADVMVYCENGRNCLHYAAERGHSEVSSLLIQEFPQLRDSTTRGAAKCPPNDSGKTALMLASQYGKVEVLLIEHKASVMMTSEEGWNCLHYAARWGHFEVSKLIIEACPEIINDGTMRTKITADLEYMNSNKTPLMIACRYGHERVVELLLEHKADVRMRDECGWNCLHYAGRWGGFEVSKLIVEACPEIINYGTKRSKGSADLNTMDLNKTPLMLACLNGREDVVKLLLEHKADVMIFNDSGCNCFHYAASWGRFEVSKLIIEACPEIINIGTLGTNSSISSSSSSSIPQGSTPVVKVKIEKNITGLMLACESGNEQVVRLLLAHKADVMVYCENGRNCLHYAAERGHSEVSSLLIQEFPQLRDSTTRGAAKCPPNDSGKTALMLASQYGKVEVVRTLLSHKADVMLRSEEGCDVLLYAARSDDLKVLELIIEAVVKSVVDANSPWWQRTLIWASEIGHLSVVGMLLKYKIDVTLQNGDGHNCLHLAAKNSHFQFLEVILAKDTEGFVNSTTSAGETSLMLAAQNGDVEVAKILLKYNASVLECNENGWNCLHFAASQGKIKVMLEILNHPDLEKLVDSKTKAGRTALILAAENGYADVVKLLIHKNCNELLCDDEGFSCLHVAAKHGHLEVLSHLLSEEGDQDYWDRERFSVGDIESKIRRLDPNSLLLTSKRLELMEVRSCFERLTALHMAGISHRTAIVSFLERTYYTLALRSRRFLLDPVTTFICYEAQSLNIVNLRVDDFFYGSALSATTQLEYSQLLEYFRASRKKFMEPVRGLVRCAESEARNGLEENWRQFLGRNHEVVDFVADKADYDGLSTSNLLDLSGMVEANLAVVRYVNARDITGRTALHYLAATCDCEHLKEIDGCRMAFQNVLGTPFYDVVAADWRGYTPLHLAAYNKNSDVIKMFVTSTCSSEEKRLMYNSKGARIMNVEDELREAGVADCRFYQPKNGHIHKCLWQEERDGIIPLHYAVEKYYPDYGDVVESLVKASRLNLITKTSNLDSPFTIAMSQGAHLYDSGGNKNGMSRDNILSPGRQHATKPSNMNIKCQGNQLSMFKSLEKEAILCIDDPNVTKEDRNSLWVELIWSMREILEEKQIDVDKRRKMLTDMNELGHCGGLTILHYAAFRGLLDELQDLLRVRELREMVDCPCTVSGQTMMHFAVIEKHTEVVNWLRKESFGRLDEEDKLGRTPYELLLEVLIASSSPELKTCEASLRGEKTIINYIEKQYRDRQIHVDAGNTALVGAALIASVTFAGWLQPPLGYTEYQQYTFPDSNNPESFAAVQQYSSVEVFWVLNSLSFFFAVATVVCGARAVLPASSTVFIAKEVRLIRNWLVTTSILLVISIICVLGAFGAAGFAGLPPDSKYQTSMTITSLVGGSTCAVFLFCYFLRLNEIKHWFPSFDGQSIKLWLTGGQRELGSSETSRKSGKSVETKFYALRTAKRRWINLWGLM
ncbi:LOW QUALITY PROTEIN: hypothetical protein MARPO_0035s0001 [Marchantia polymorpha]|uniref:PGG domain-containing protein n=1 Tax=Marchantia polymorpha TaxID=3197 RepID=A0A2R6X543_MARPO|nr:LOW QUALITY PROTEIN: hypothetical protein MARPO_0035s0001 [Marchantia polymorpha]|eukprot:PTQ41189.1 LOW QUALITY PROTEIN: hypothetical protein MARPO_0035s0001 [Marchantia polymorpha]